MMIFWRWWSYQASTTLFHTRPEATEAKTPREPKVKYHQRITIHWRTRLNFVNYTVDVDREQIRWEHTSMSYTTAYTNQVENILYHFTQVILSENHLSKRINRLLGIRFSSIFKNSPWWFILSKALDSRSGRVIIITYTSKSMYHMRTTRPFLKSKLIITGCK